MATLQQVMIGGLLFITVFTGLIITFTDFVTTYDLTPDENYFTSNYQNATDIEQIYNLTKEMQSKSEEHKGDQENLDTSVIGSLNAIKKVINIFDLVKKSINFIAITLHFPIWMVNSILAGILITVVLAVYAAFLGRRTD